MLLVLLFIMSDMKHLDKTLVVVLAIAMATYIGVSVASTDASLETTILLAILLCSLTAPMIWALWELANLK